MKNRQLEVAHVERLRRLIRDKKFRRYLIKKCHPIAIDGTQKLAREGQWWDEPWLERRRDSGEREQVQQYIYVLEANLAFHNGLSIPPETVPPRHESVPSRIETS